jgi:hypothetical protein
MVVANAAAELSPLLPGFCVGRVDFPPNRLHDLKRGQKKSEAFYDAFRMDKNGRVLACIPAMAQILGHCPKGTPSAHSRSELDPPSMPVADTADRVR